jgi:hypothetical protein
MKNIMESGYPGFLLLCSAGFISLCIYFISIEMIKLLKGKLLANSIKSKTLAATKPLQHDIILTEFIADDNTEKREKTYPEFPFIRGRGV